MVRNYIKFILFCLIAIVQLTLMPIFSIYGVWPNLVLTCAIVLLLTDHEKDAFYLAALGGIILDLAGTLPMMGFNTLFLVGLIYLLKLIIKKFFSDINFLTLFITVFLSSILFCLFNFLLLFRPPERYIIIEGFYSAALATIMFVFINSKTKEDSFKIRDNKNAFKI
jgi:rod shape-determining protein MreD